MRGLFAWQAALLAEFENLPVVFQTDSLTQKGQLELLTHIAQQRTLHTGK